MLADTHCHLDFAVFDPDRDAVIDRARKTGVQYILVPGIDLVSSQSAIHLADDYAGLFAAVGFHPSNSDGLTSNDFKELWRMAGHPKVKAIGEIGLDYFHEPFSRHQQIHIFTQQLEMASELALPVIVHFRNTGDRADGACSDDLMRLLDDWISQNIAKNSPLVGRPGVLHSFSGTISMALQAIELGFRLGFSGPVTFKKASLKHELASIISLENILLETDAPFLSPHPYRGRRNEPANVQLIADKISLLRGCQVEKVAGITTHNARQLFQWE